MIRNKLNRKAFTLVEIVVAIAILATAAIGIGAMIVGARNNSQKQLSESELQQQLVEVQESLRNDILATNAGIKYWTDDGSGFVADDGSSDSENKNKILAMYAIDYLDYTVKKTYIKYNTDEKILYKYQAANLLEPDENDMIIIDESINEVISEAQGSWDVYAQDVTTFSIDFSKYRQNNTVNYSVVTSVDDQNYSTDNTVNIRNEIAVNEPIDVEMPENSIVVAKPVLETSRYTYNGQLRMPNETSLNSRYIEKSGEISGTDAGTYEITYTLKSPDAIWSDGTSQPYTIRWIIEKRKVSVTWGQLAWVYDGSSTHSTTVSLGNIVPGDTCEPSLSNNSVGPEVGTSEVTLTLMEPEGKANYTVAAADAKATLSIKKSIAALTQIPTAKDLTYNGSPQELINKGETSEGTLVYSLNRTGPFDTAIPKATDSNKETPYLIYYYVQGDKNHEDSSVDSLEAIIKQAEPVVTAPEPISPINYNSNSQELIRAGSSTGGEMVYNCDGGNFGPDIPTGINAGTHKVGYKSLENANYKESKVEYIDVVISKSAAIYTKPTAREGLVYDGTDQQLIVAGTATDGAWEYNVDGGDWAKGIPARIPAKDSYVVGFRLPATEDYEAVQEDYLNVKIDKAPATCEPPVPKNGLVFNSTPQVLIDGAITNSGTMYYGFVADKATMSQELPSRTDAKEYEVFYYVMGDSNHYDSEIGSVIAKINKAESVISLLPKGIEAEYNEQFMPLLQFGGQPEGNNGTIVYTLTPEDDDSWIDTIPEGIDAGEYSIYYKIVGNENYGDSAICAEPIRSVITQAQNSFTAPQAIPDLVYNGEQQLLIVRGSVRFGKMEYSLDNINWSTDIPMGLDAGEYKVYYRVQETNNWSGTTGVVDCSIGKAVATITAPEGQTLTYNGENQALVLAGSCTPGTLYYRLEGGSWSSSIPTGMNVGTYVVEYKVDAGSNYTVPVNSVKTTIIPGQNTAEAPESKEMTYDGTQQALIKAGTPKWGTMEYSLDNETWSVDIPTGQDTGTYTVYWRVAATENYSPELSGYVTSKINVRQISIPHILESDKQLKYTGSELTPRLVYENAWVTASGQLSAIDVDPYSIVFTLNDTDNTQWEDGDSAHSKLDYWDIIKVKAFTDTDPTGIDITYDTIEHNLLETLGESSTGTIKFRLAGESDDDWRVESPVATNAGTYLIEYKIFGDRNHEDSEIKTITSYIRKATIEYDAPDVEFDYDGAAHSGTVKVTLQGNDTATITYGTTKGNYSSAIPQWSELGEHITYFKIVADNYNTVESSFKVTIKITSVNLPTGVTLNYDGAEHVLLKAPENPIESTTSRLEFGFLDPVVSEEGSESNEEPRPTTWSAEYPTGTDASSYYIYVRIAYLSEEGTVISTEDAGIITSYIRPVNTIFTIPFGLDRISNEDYQTIHTPGSIDYGSFIYNYEPTGEEGSIADENGILIAIDEGTYDFSWRIHGDDNHLDFPSDDEYAYHSDVTIKQYEEP